MHKNKKANRGKIRLLEPAVTFSVVGLSMTFSFTYWCHERKVWHWKSFSIHLTEYRFVLERNIDGHRIKNNRVDNACFDDIFVLIIKQ